MALLITITNAGRAEMINAENTGTGPVVITEIGLGTAQYLPSKAQTALTNQLKRVNSIAGLVVADDTIHVMAKDEGPDTYNVGEFGLFSASGTLVAVYSQLPEAGWIIQKAGASTLLLAVDIILESLNAANLTFGDVTFINPPATTETPGVVQLENSLTSPSTSKALTAAQGKKLQDEKAPLDSPALSGMPTAPTAVAGANTNQLANTAFVTAVKALLDAAINLKAPLASPALTGIPTAPTAAAGTNTTQLATTAFVAAVKTLLDAAINLKAPLASPALTGLPTAPTAVAGTNNTQLATTAFVAAVKDLLDAAINLKAPLASPALTGLPTAPTAVAGTNNTQLATTAFVAAVQTLLNTAINLKADKATTLAGYGITDAILFKIGLEIEDAAVSWNSLVKEGVHSRLILGSNPQGPGPALYFYCRTYVRLSVAGGSGALQQFAEPYGSPTDAGQMYWRGLNGTDWTGWVKVMDSADAATQADAEGFASTDRWMSALRTWQAMVKYGAELAPPGVVAPFARNTPPAGWLKSNGAAVSRTTYAALFAAIGTTFGAGDGSTTFNLPDARAEIVRGWDDGRGVDSGRVFGSIQKGSLVAFDPTSVASALTGLHSTGSDATARADVGLDAINPADYPGIDVVSAAASSTLTSSSSAGVSRPRNISLLYCIKY